MIQNTFVQEVISRHTSLITLGLKLKGKLYYTNLFDIYILTVNTDYILLFPRILNTDENIKSLTNNENQNFETFAVSHKLDVSIGSDQNLKDDLSDQRINDKSQEKVFEGKYSTPYKSQIQDLPSYSKNEDKWAKTPESPQNNDVSVKTKIKTDTLDSSSEKNSFEILMTPKRNVSYSKSFGISPITPISANQSRDIDNSLYKFSTPTPIRSSYENTPNSKFSTPPNNHHRDRRSANQRNICLADFMTTNKSSPGETASTKKKKNRFLNLSLNDPLINSSNKITNFNNTVNDEIVPFNIEDRQMFPSTLTTPNQNFDSKPNARNNRRRIKPTKLNNTFPNDDQLNVNVNGTSSIKFGVKYDKAEQNDAFKIQNCQIAENCANFETERDILKKEKTNLIQKFNQISTPKKILTSSAPISVPVLNNSSKKCIIEFCLKKVDNIDVLNIFSSLFSVIIDYNLIPNILSEIYYLLSLNMIEMQSENSLSCTELSETTQTANSDELEMEKTVNCDTSNMIFDNVHNVIYFALSCLEKQKFFLSVILDKNSLRLFLKNYNIEKYSSDFAESLSQMLAEKVAIDEKKSTTPAICDNLNRNVYFISETDNADNFPTKRDFLTFKSQRDGFYEIYR